MDFFYNKKYGDAVRRLKLLQDQYGRTLEDPARLDRDEVEDLMGALLELRGGLRKLQWYGEVNRRGFIKITKKLDKKVAEVTAQKRYLESKVDLKPFASNVDLLETINTINDWLSTLGEVKYFDDASSTHSGKSMHRASSKVALSLSQALLESFDQVVRNDLVSDMAKLLEKAELEQQGSQEDSHLKLLLGLLQRSISCRSKACIARILEQLPSLEEPDDMNQRNVIHRMIISMSRVKAAGALEKMMDKSLNNTNENANYITPAAPPVLAPPLPGSKESDGILELGKDDKVVLLFEYLLDNLTIEQRPALQMRDTYGRMPLHYAAQYGFVVICKIVISRMQSWGQYEVSEGIDAPFWQDSEGWAPLHLSVIGGHHITTRTLLEAEDWKGTSNSKAAVKRHMSKFGDVLALATKKNFVIIVQLLVEAGVDLNHQDDQGETALYIAARMGHTECAEVLLKGSCHQKANTEMQEKSFGWTPLLVACVDGNLPVVELLIEAGADLERPDMSGWTAKEHAALRGHIDIARRLVEKIPQSCQSSCISPCKLSASLPINSSLTDRRSNCTSNGSGPPTRTTEPVKTFGHRYLTDESMILVSLGTMDIRKNIEVVKLDRIPLAHAHSTQLDTALSIVVSATGATGEPSIVDLPVQDNISTEPLVFTTVDATKVKLLFDIVPTYAGTKDQIIGRGVALLSSIRPSIGSQRITLQGDVTVPIMAAHNLEVIGSVNFNFLIITPFKHPKMSITENQTYWKSMASTMVIGHRGDCAILSYASHFLTFMKAWVKTWLLENHFSSGRTPFRYDKIMYLWNVNN